jgi:hypothetical protein
MGLVDKLELRYAWEQSRYPYSNKARRVNWDKARNSMDNRLFISRSGIEC